MVASFIYSFSFMVLFYFSKIVSQVFPMLLPQELDKAWALVDAAHDKERRDEENIRILKEDVAKLIRKDEQQAMDQEHM